MIINIRGTNGSGKSTIVRKLLAASSSSQPKYGCMGARQPEAYRLMVPGVAKPIYVLGPYIANIGGCDRIRPYDSILDLVRKYAAQGHVVFEGVLISDNYGRMGELLESYGKSAVLMYLDTPLEVCLNNIQARTGEGSKTKHVERKFHEIKKVRGWFLENGKVRIEDVSMNTGYPRLMELLSGECVGDRLR